MKKDWKERTGGAGLCLSASIIWGFAFPLQQIAGQYFDAFTVTFLRSVIAVFTLALVVLLLDRVKKTGRRLFSFRGGFSLDITKQELVGGICCGFALGSATVVQQVGIDLCQTSGKAAFLTALYVAFVPLFGFFIKRRTTLPILCCSIVALVGAGMLSIREGVDFAVSTGDLLVILSAALYAVHILTIDRFSSQCDGVRMSLVQFATISVLLLPSLFFTVRADGWENALLAVFYLGMMSSGAAYTLQIVAQGKTHPAVAAALLSMESVFGALGSYLIFGETMSPRQWVGACVLFISAVASQLFSAYQKKD